MSGSFHPNVDRDIEEARELILLQKEKERSGLTGELIISEGKRLTSALLELENEDIARQILKDEEMTDWNTDMSTPIAEISTRPLSTFHDHLLKFLKKRGGKYIDEEYSYQIIGNDLVRTKYDDRYELLYKTETIRKRTISENTSGET